MPYSVVPLYFLPLKCPYWCIKYFLRVGLIILHLQSITCIANREIILDHITHLFGADSSTHCTANILESNS